MQPTAVPRGPILAEEHERSGIKELAALFASSEDATVRLAGLDHQSIAVPESARRVIHAALASLSRGEAVEVVTYQPEVSVFQAAALLGLPTGALDRLLDEGVVPFRQTDQLRLIAFREVMAYRARQDVERSKALDALIRLTEEYGLYEAELARHSSRQPVAP